MSWLPLASVLQHARALHFFICFEPFAGLVRLRTCLPYTTRATADMGGILSRAEGSPKASQNACRQSVLGSIDLVSLCVDYLVVDELYGSARPVCPAWRAAADLTPGRLSLERRPGESRAAFNWIEGMSFQLIGGVPDEPDAESSTVIYNQSGLPSAGSSGGAPRPWAATNSTASSLTTGPRLS